MMAYLGTAPKPPKGSRRAKTAEDAPRVSRLERMRRDGVTPAMPPNPMPHLIDWLVEIGLSEAAGMGQALLSWREINAWCARTGIDLDPWAARTIRRLSQAYLTEQQRAEEETCPPPWRAEVSRREIETEEARLRAVLG